MISAPRSSRSRWVTALTAPRVPTGMNAGVCTTPCGVVSSPRRARAVAIQDAGTRKHRSRASKHSNSRSLQASAGIPSPVSFRCETTARRRAVRRPVRRTRGVAGVGGGGVRESRSARATSRCRSGSKRMAGGRSRIEPPTAVSAAEVIEQARLDAARPSRSGREVHLMARPSAETILSIDRRAPTATTRGTRSSPG